MNATRDPDVPYLLPRVPSEIDRLDLQHYALRQAIGANYLAPVRSPARVLDVGAGTGQWAFDLCDEFPDAEVVGFDLVPGKPERPANYRFTQGNLLQGLPFENDSFDFVHQRALLFGVPIANWKTLVAELVRITRPGGWVELVESDCALQPIGRSMGTVLGLTRRALSAGGLDSTGMVILSLDRWLRDAGLLGVNRRDVRLPIGEWGGRLGALMATDARNVISHFLSMRVQEARLSEGERRELLVENQREWEALKATLPVAVAYGRKPVS